MTMLVNTKWSLKKLREALNDYDIKSAHDYLGMTELWLQREEPKGEREEVHRDPKRS
ncbi:MAG: hypothetical protein [Caudoviricetes sp.]|nr:MAG: hypothetical protein [Caudoviricetes sp.]